MKAEQTERNIYIYKPIRLQYSYVIILNSRSRPSVQM